MNFGILVFSLPAFKHNQSTIAKDMSNVDRYKARTNIHALGTCSIEGKDWVGLRTMAE